jgi:hypothetical protein
MFTSCTRPVCPTLDRYFRRAVKLLLLDDADSTSNPRPASIRLKNSALSDCRRTVGRHGRILVFR